MGTTTLDNNEYLALVRKIEDGEKLAAELRAEIERIKKIPLDETTRRLIGAFASAKNIVDFAVANLSPEFIRDWPWACLEHLAGCVAEIGGDRRDGERAMIWAEHVRDIRHYELKRQLRAAEPPPPQTTPDNLTPEIELE